MDWIIMRELKIWMSDLVLQLLTFWSNYKIVYLIPIVIIGIILINIVLSPLFCSKAYYKRITINTEGVFSDDVKEVDFNKMPLLDRDSSEKLGDRSWE